MNKVELYLVVRVIEGYIGKISELEQALTEKDAEIARLLEPTVSLKAAS
jgi:hypothetical protein